MDVVIPPNTSAMVYVPGKNVREKTGAKSERVDGDATVFALGSGHYSFSPE